MKERSSAIVTGASSGIGKAIACMLVEEGYEVYGIARHYDGDVSFNKVIADVTDTDSVLKVFSEVKDMPQDHHRYQNQLLRIERSSSYQDKYLSL